MYFSILISRSEIATSDNPPPPSKILNYYDKRLIPHSAIIVKLNFHSYTLKMNCTIFLYHSLSSCVLEFTVTSFTPYFFLRDSGYVERFSAGIGSSVRCNSKSPFFTAWPVIEGGGGEDQDQGRQT